MTRRIIRASGLMLVAALSMPALADLHFRNLDEPDAPQWAEGEVNLPPFPGDDRLIEFAVTASTNRFFVDGSSIAPGSDGVVRYVLVVRTAGGATNVSFEGIRCASAEHRIYATGQAGAWVRARDETWRRIERKTLNSYLSTLNRDFFCPAGMPITGTEEGRSALRRGIHPRVPGASIYQ